MSALDHLKEYRVVQVVLPLIDGEQQALDGVALSTNPPQFEVTFLPNQLKTDQLDQQTTCRISFEVGGPAQSLNAQIEEVLSDTKLQFRAVETFTHSQKRSYFRIDASLSVSYWPASEDNSAARPVQTPVNISGGGIRIPVEEALPVNSKVGLEIVLDGPDSNVLKAVGEVVRIFEVGSGTQLALKFTDIEQEDQDAIVAYCFAEQRKQLRLKVSIMGPPE